MARVLSIEITMSQIRVAEMEMKGKSARVRSCFRIATPQDSVEDGYIRDPRNLGEAIKNELLHRKIKTKKVNFTVASTRIASREVRIPYVKNSRIQSIVEANAGEYFPIDAEKYVISYSVIDVEESGDEKEKTKQYHLMVYASPRSISASYQELCRNAGLTLTRLDSVGNSIYSSVKEKYTAGTHILMKIEEKNTLITVVKDGELSLQRNLNYGVDSAVETVRAYPVFGSNLSTEEATEVLRTKNCIRGSLDMPPEEFEPEDTDEFVREARREVTESLRYLVGNISRIMDYYISRNQGAEFSSLECCGLGAQVCGLIQLFTYELGIPVSVLKEAPGFVFPKENENDFILSDYLAVAGSMKSSVNLLEKVTKKQKEETESLKGSFLIFFLGFAGALVLGISAVGMRLFQEKEQERLQRRIREESSVEQVYNAYNTAKSRYESFRMMYVYTNTPNEGLVSFIEEMEKKMPSSITVENFSSTGTEVSFSMRVESKEEAANTLMQLRTFESLQSVASTGIDESEEGTVSMSVICAYAEPALLESGE